MKRWLVCLLLLCMPGYGFAATITVPNVAALADARVGDGDLVQTAGQVTADDGGGMLYRYDAGSAAVADGVLIVTGPGGIGRYLSQAAERAPLIAHTIPDDANLLFDVTRTDATVMARTLSLEELKKTGVQVVNVKQHGAVGDGVTDDTAAIQAAIDAAATVGGVCYVPLGTYKITSTLTVTQTNYFRLIGSGNQSVFKSAITNGTALLDLNDAQHCSIENFKIQAAGDTTPTNFIGIEFGGANRWSITNVTVFEAATGVKFDSAHIGSISNLFIRYCTTGFDASSFNDVRGDIHIENVAKGFVINGASNASLSIMVEGAHRTSSSTIDNTHGSRFDFYFEDSDAATVAEVSVGATTNCTGNVFYQTSSHTTGTSVPIFAIDKVKGLEIIGATTLNAFYNFASTTSSTIGLTIRVRDLTSATNYPVPIVANSSFRAPVNYFPDPYFHYGIPATRSDSNATSSTETSIVPPFATKSLKVAATAGQTLCYTNVNLTVASRPYLAELLGKTVGVGYWLYVPSGYTFANNAVGADLFVRANGTGSPVTATRSQVWNKGNWIFIVNEVSVPSDTTSFDIRYHANRSGGTSDANTLAYFVGPLIWIGGLSNAERAANGQISDHPAAALPSLANVLRGAGTPESSITAPIGTLYLRTDGGASTTLYIKESGTGNTGWVAK